MHRLTVRFEGRVQGVGFRLNVAELARTHAVKGWVCNVADGSVRLVAEGQQDVLLEFQAAIRQRMGRNIVREQVSWGTVEHCSWADFQIAPDQNL